MNISNYKSSEDKIGEQYVRYNQNDNIVKPINNVSASLNRGFADVYSENANKQYSLSNEPDIDYVQKTEYLVVSSKDRDAILYPNSSRFVINLQKSYKNVKSIELIQAIIPDQNNVQLEPYLLLKIDEIEGVMDSLDTNISDAFAILQLAPPTITGSFIVVDKRIFENTMRIFKTPKASLQKLTISLTDSDGIGFNFGGTGTISKAFQTTFVLKITMVEKNRNSLNSRATF